MADDSAQLKAALDYLRDEGATRINLRDISEAGEHIIWCIVAEFSFREGISVEAATSALRAVIRMCESITDGTICANCKRRAAFEPDWVPNVPTDRFFPKDNPICWRQYDPELKVYRRSCE